jgi:hypothetical protein
MTCQAITRAGRQCGAHSLRGTRRCFLHSDAKRASALGSLGGRRRTTLRPDALKRFPVPGNAAELRKLLGATIVEIRSASIDPKSANAIAALAGAFLRCVELGDLEARVKRLEDRRANGGKENGLK